MLRIIGDVHGKTQKYFDIAKESEYSLQLGDLGFGRDLILLNQLDSTKHRVLLGNHDDYGRRNDYPHFLGDYGVLDHAGLKSAFYYRGGRSIDWMYRREGIDFFREEEIESGLTSQAIDMFCDVKPSIMFSHECPFEIIPFVSGMKTFDGEKITPSLTSLVLGTMFLSHKPKVWFFGHHHKDVNFIYKGTRFICLGELSHYDLEV